jgi:RNA polymerase primary sigma factor
MLYKPQSFDEEIAEIGQILAMDDEHIKELICISREMLSLESPITTDKTISLGDVLVDNNYEQPDQSAEQEFLKVEIKNLLTTLDQKEAFIISNHFGIGEKKSLTLKELGELLNLSKERIRQIEMKAINRLQNPKRKEKLDMYVA